MRHRRIPEFYVGTRINKFTVLSINTEICSNRSVKVFSCQCDCGKIFSYQAGKVFSNQIQSCGCSGKSTRSQNRSIRDRLYIVWIGMKNRCSDPQHHSYSWYGGRGISYCSEWESFDTFYSDMKAGYREGLDLDRENNNLGYSKKNCRWITHRENIHSQSRSRLVRQRSGYSEWAALLRLVA